MNYKFKVGDKVEVILNGSGFDPGKCGLKFTIVEQGIYYGSVLGYKVIDSSGTIHSNDGYDDFVGERSFELVEEPWTPQPGEWVDALITAGHWQKRQYVGKMGNHHLIVTNGRALDKEFSFEVLAVTEVKQIPTTKTVKIGDKEIEISIESYQELLKLKNK